MPDALPSLLSRIEAATGPDREIDAAIYLAITGEAISPALAPAYTSSVDAVLGIIKWELPGWGMSVSLKPGLGSWACVNEPDAVVEIVRGEAATPALALLAALIRAKIAQTE